MRILVTGGAGYIGSHAVQKLLENNFEVTVFDNLSTGFAQAIPPGARLIQGDVRNRDLFVRVLQEQKIKAVMHFAAKLIPEESIQKPVEYYDNNVGGTLSVIRSCQKQGIEKIIFSSTAALYGFSPETKMIDETMPIAPVHPYGHSKAICEQMLSDCQSADSAEPLIRSVSLRYFNVAGASINGQNGPRTLLASNLIKVAAETAAGKRSEMAIFGTDYLTPDGTCIRDYIHVDDLVDLHLRALNYLDFGVEPTGMGPANGSAVSSVFNCGYGHGFSVREVLKMMKKVSGVDFKVLEKPRRQGDLKFSVADVSKARKILNWSPLYSDLELICRTAYEWEKENS